MKTKDSKDQLETRAAEALRALLGQVSAIKLKQIRRESKGSVFADVDVLGHRHTLACEVKASAHPEKLRSTLRQWNSAPRQEATIPVLIAPYLSPEAQAICKESHAGFIDLEGNARLAMGEVFIGKRAFTPHSSVTASSTRNHAHHNAPVPPAA